MEEGIPLNVTLTASEMDMLDLAAYRISPNAGIKLRKALMVYYLKCAAEDAEKINKIKNQCPMTSSDLIPSISSDWDFYGPLQWLG